MNHQQDISKQKGGETMVCRDSARTFGIYQIYYSTKLRRFLDPAFIPYENLENERPEWREFHVFRKEWLAGTMKRHSYTGFFSWKFREKARIEGRALLDFAKANPGADCYFINPFPQELIQFQNLWLQGEHCHPRLIETTEKIFRDLGYNANLAGSIHTSDVACYCNFWLATPRFWDAYMEFCLPVYDYIENRATEQERSVLWAGADKKSDATMVPYIFERLFTEFLLTKPGFRVTAFRYSPEHFQRRFYKRFNAVYQGSDALKRAQIRNPDEELLLGMNELSKAAALMCKSLLKRERRRLTATSLRDTWNRLRGLPLDVLPP